MIHKILKSEIKNLSSNPDYWGTEKNVANENKIFDWFLNTQAVNQDWFDNRQLCTNVELLKELEKEYFIFMFGSEFLESNDKGTLKQY
jgi:hypothetical protein|tara:strand:- start:807 stop:1070 length:264 start_codon:yes stop_codon:yes gene_type:complete